MRKDSCRLVLGLLWLAALATPAAATSLRFFGNGTNDIDRVKIQVDNPANSQPGPPADIGATDFTIEFWIRGTLDTVNSRGDASCGAGYGWINGNIVLDRDRYDQGRTYGVSLGDGRVQFGVKNAGGTSYTLCSNASVLDDQWHHIALTRVLATGELRIFIDGVPDGVATGPTGDLSFPDDGTPLPNRCNGGTSTCPNDPYLVIGAEKHDVDAVQYPAFSGYVDELRLSTNIRYTAAFTRPSAPFVADANTAALYHFDEGSGTAAGDSANGGASPGTLRVGGSPTGPIWSAATPFAAGSAGTLQWSSSTASVGEAAGSVTISATRANGSSGAVTAQYATSNGTATAGSDYAPASGTLTWGDGVLTQSFSLAVTNDSIDESDETLTVTLSNPTGATLGSPTTLTVTIVDDDVTPQPGVLQWTATTATAGEGAGSVTLTATRGSGSSGAVSVNYATVVGSAAAGSDFTAASGTLNWAAGDTANKSITVPILEDTAVEGTESFSVQLTAPGGGATLGANATITVSITDNDAAPQPGVLQWTATTATAGEGAGSVTLTATRGSGSSGAVSVNYATVVGSAAAGSDFTAASGTLNWAAGDTANKSITVPILEDTAVEGTESFSVQLTAPGGGATLGANATTTVSITDNDAAPQPGVLQWSASTASVTEGAASVTLTATRSNGSDGAVSVSYATVVGSAQAGSDFTATNGTLSWAAGDSANKSVTIPIANDLVVESTESFTVALSAATGGATLGGTTQITVTITDDDTAPPSGGGSSGGGAFDAVMLGLLAALVLLGRSRALPSGARFSRAAPAAIRVLCRARRSRRNPVGRT